MKIITFHQLTGADLEVDAVYRGGATGNLASEVLSKLFPVGNVGGFRWPGKWNETPLVIHTSNENEAAWPDFLDPYTGTVEYFGDNRSPGELHATRGGNRILRSAFEKTFSDDRQSVPIFLYFTKWKKGWDWQFRGLLVPGGKGATLDDSLRTVWRTSKEQRFQNFAAKFTVLDTPVISRDWINSLLSGNRENHAPDVYLEWLRKGKYKPLTAPRVDKTRSKANQQPQDDKGRRLIEHLTKRFPKPEAWKFEAVALEIWSQTSGNRIGAELTRQVVDGGRDAIGYMYVGPPGDQLGLDFLLEAKCYSSENSLGVKETSRLISRIRRHQFGVIVTTSYLGDQAYKEIREDGHPLVIITGRDIVEMLISQGIDTIERLDAWLDKIERQD